MMLLFGWAATRAGRIILAIMAALSALFFVFCRVFSAGKAAQKAEQNKEALNAHRDRERIDDDISKMDESRTRAELSRWMRAGGS